MPEVEKSLDPPEKAIRWDRSVMTLNAPRWHIRANIRNNIRRFLPQMEVYPENPQKIAIVGGGWSLNDTLEELRHLYFNGVKLIALNGAARWLMERNLRPSMYVQIDSRSQNCSFVLDPIPQCKYFLASQCHSHTFDLCKDRDVTIFHVVSEGGDQERRRIDTYYKGRWQEVPCAGTVGTVSIMLCRMLGFRFQHLFGLDSCYSPSTAQHHAYEQKWNNGEGAAEFWIAGRRFMCSAWQASQAGEFVDFLRANGHAVCLEIHGDGVLAHIMRVGAETAGKDLDKALGKEKPAIP